MSIAVQPKRVILDATSDEIKLHGKSRGCRGLLEVRDVVFFEPSISEEFNSLRVEGLWSSF